MHPRVTSESVICLSFLEKIPFCKCVSLETSLVAYVLPHMLSVKSMIQCIDARARGIQIYKDKLLMFILIGSGSSCWWITI